MGFTLENFNCVFPISEVVITMTAVLKSRNDSQGPERFFSAVGEIHSIMHALIAVSRLQGGDNCFSDFPRLYVNSFSDKLLKIPTEQIPLQTNSPITSHFSTQSKCHTDSAPLVFVCEFSPPNFFVQNKFAVHLSKYFHLQFEWDFHTSPQLLLDYYIRETIKP